MGYMHLTKEERYQIRAMQKMESSIGEMANVLDRAPSTISRGGAAVTLVERKSRFLRIGKLPGKSIKATVRAIQRRLRPIAERVQTLTLDNGKELSRHQVVARALDVAVFFADPYASWQRGTNENTNGLIRQYLPKNRDLSTLTGAEILKIERRINNRPRKCLDYRTPHEVFNKTHGKLTVALRG
ncbi:MAG: IS30 family transposase [Wenzhouxiangellaceae bacterium]|nr:IS30 family transposase [Wenzhouxiangellaceae bacterium]MBS3822507.1 IS30 family transposase [Wenzhouxiangellaceae bacterium]